MSDSDQDAGRARRGASTARRSQRLPAEPAIQIVGLVDGLEESWTALQETPTDLLVVACGRLLGATRSS